MPKYLLILSLLLPLATGCEREAGDDTAGQQPVVFTAHTGGEDATRAGVIDDSNLSSMGVFACYTGQSGWSESTSKSNFMYNQPVNKTGDIWTYTPVKYWPNTEGDKLSFFAYAPHAEKVGSQLRTYGYNSSDATGYPSFRYEPPVDATQQTDLLFATPLMNRTKGSELSFTMGHVLTHVLFKVKSTSAISVTKIQVNSGSHYGDIKFNTSGYSWTSLTGNQSFYKTATVAVPANTLTDLGEFFLLPSNAESVSLTFSEGGIEQPVTTVALPASPVWEMNKTVAYTLNIENKTKVTLSVKSWDTGSVSANLGEEVPTSGYPFRMNGFVYRSATEFFYVGAVRTDFSGGNDGWYNWYEAVDICKKKYSNGPYSSSEWRLPTVGELENIIRLGFPSSTYWAITETSSTNAYRCTNWQGFSAYDTPKDNMSPGGRILCIRDMGTITPPTLRRKNGYTVVYQDNSTTYALASSYSGWITYSAAVSYCTNGEWGGYKDWRLPTLNEAVYCMRTWGLLFSQAWTSTSAGAGQHYTVNENGQNPIKSDEALSPDGTGQGHTWCVRDY